MRKFFDESGQALILVALSLPVMFGFVALATDVGLLFRARETLQTAADSAAISGAAEYNYGDATSAAQAASAQNGVTNGVNGATVTVNTPPLLGMYQGQSGYVEVIVSQPQQTFLMGMITGSNSVKVTARSVAALAASSNCLYLLSSSGTALNASNGSSVDAPNCGIVVDSSSSSAISLSGGADVTASSVGVVGGVTTDNSGSKTTPAAVTGIVPVSDPLAFLQPPSYSASSCTADPGSYYQGGATYSVGPGSAHSTTQGGNLVCYTSLTLGGNGDTVTVNPGIYVITGSLSAASGTILGGNGVMFYLPGTASVSIANGAKYTLTAPTSGTYNGVLFYQDRSNSEGASIQGGAQSTLQGILYFPDAALTLDNGTGSAFSIAAIAKTLSMAGGASLTTTPYSSTNLSSVLSSPRLME